VHPLSFPEISEEEENLFTRLATKMKLNSEIEEIKIEIEKNSIKESIEGINLSEEQDSLKERKKLLEEEHEESSDNFPFLIFKLELREISSRLQKLEDRKDTISDAVYESIFEEYTGKLQEAQMNLNKEEKRIREIQYQCKNFLENLDTTKEELIVRSELGEISKEELNSKLTEYDNQKKRAEDLVSVTNDILD
jgi:hypothetical protein